MVLTKSCPRCNGDLYQDQDHAGYCLRCVQCGHEIQLRRKLERADRLSPAMLGKLSARTDPSRLLVGEQRHRSGRHRVTSIAKKVA